MFLQNAKNRKRLKFIFTLLLAGFFSIIVMWAESPVIFNLYSKGEPGVLFTVDAPLSDNLMVVELINNSSGNILLKDFSDTESGDEAFHFIFQFDPGILDEESISGEHQIGLSGESAKLWKMRLTQEGSPAFTRIYLTARSPRSWAAREKKYICFINAGAGRGSFGQTKVTLKTFNMTGSQGEPILAGESDLPVRVINFFVKKEIPLYVGFSDSGAVLNDGTSPNALKLQISNILTRDPEPLVFKYSQSSSGRSRLILFFDLPGSPDSWFSQTGMGQSSIHREEGHLASGDAIKEIAVTSRQKGWIIEKDLQGAYPKWIIEPAEANQYLAPHETLGFTLDGIMTAFRSGGCNLYVIYENIPGYRDGQLVCPIVKQPMFVRDKKVGIGTTEPESELHVKGALGVDGAVGVTGALGIKGPLGVEGAFGLEGPLEVAGSMKLNGDRLFSFPPGTIILWNGSANDLPGGWLFCDGKYGTPNLPAPPQSRTSNSVYYIIKKFRTTPLIAAGSFYSLILKEDGSVWGAGQNSHKQLGPKDILYDQTNRYDQINWITNPELKYVKRISAGNSHSLALDEKRRVWAAGSNQAGALGFGGSSDNFGWTPNSQFRNVESIVAGSFCSLAVKEDGALWFTGSNENLKLGLEDRTSIYRWTQNPRFRNVKMVAAGNNLSLLLLEDGTVWGAGSNYSGQLGQGYTGTGLSWTLLTGLKNVKMLAAGESHSLAVMEDGTVWGAGSNNVGQLGLGETWQSKFWIRLPGLENIEMVVAGYDYSLALKKDGSVWGTGLNDHGQLALGEKDRVRSWTPLPGIEKVKIIAAGFRHSMALTEDETVWVTGDNSNGQLGLGHKESMRSWTKSINLNVY